MKGFQPFAETAIFIAATTQQTAKKDEKP